MSKQPNIRIDRGDSFSKVKALCTDSVQLTVTSPPYNLGKSYESKIELQQYLAPYEEFIAELHRVTSDDGSVCWQVGNHVNDGAVTPLDIHFFPLFQRAGFVLKNRIIWHFRHGLHAKHRLSGRYEVILWFSKSQDPLFRLDNIRIPSLYPGKRAFKGKNKGKPTGNPLGKNPSDYWPDIALQEWESCIWDFPNVKANHPEKSVHPCQFPVELAQRCIRAMTEPGHLVFDPFVGVGSSAIAALLEGRRFVGFDVQHEYVQAARARVRAARNGSLRIRQIGTPIAVPQGRVSERPLEWQRKRNQSA